MTPRKIDYDELESSLTGCILSVTDNRQTWFFIDYEDRECLLTDTPGTVPSVVRDYAFEATGKECLTEKNYAANRIDTKDTDSGPTTERDGDPRPNPYDDWEKHIGVANYLVGEERAG